MEHVQPIDLEKNGVFEGIIDIYVDNTSVDLAEAKRLGVEAVIYRTAVGLIPKRDDRNAYHKAKAKARELGLLWGAYFVPSHEDVDAQFNHFMEIEDGSDGETLIALDWEETSKGTATLDQMRDFATRLRVKLGYYPVVYGGHIPREALGHHKDEILAGCPLWYVYYLSPRHPDLLLPEPTWTEYGLWQFTDENRDHGHPYPRDVLPGADWNRFKGSRADLRAAWPLRGT